MMVNESLTILAWPRGRLEMIIIWVGYRLTGSTSYVAHWSGQRIELCQSRSHISNQYRPHRSTAPPNRGRQSILLQFECSAFYDLSASLYNAVLWVVYVLVLVLLVRRGGGGCDGDEDYDNYGNENGNEERHSVWCEVKYSNWSTASALTRAERNL